MTEPYGNWIQEFVFFQGDLLLHFFHGYSINDDRFKETLTRKQAVYLGMIWLEDKDFPIQYPITLINGSILDGKLVKPKKEKKVHKIRPTKIYQPGQAKSKRILVYERDNYTCVSCGETCKSLLTLDHIIPKSRGGSNRIHNLQTMCRKCNSAKRNSIISNNNTLGQWIKFIK